MIGNASLDTYDDVVRFSEGRLASGTDLRGSEQLICTVYCYITRQKREARRRFVERVPQKQ